MVGNGSVPGLWLAGGSLTTGGSLVTGMLWMGLLFPGAGVLTV